MMKSRLAESGLIWNRHQLPVKRGRGCGSMQPQPIHADIGERLHKLQVTQRVCVCVCSGHAPNARPHHGTESLLLPPPLNPIYVIDPRLDIGVASSDSYHFYLLNKHDCYQMEKALQSLTLKKQSKQGCLNVFTLKQRILWKSFCIII